MTNFLDKDNIKLADYINKLSPEIKPVALFALAYATFNLLSNNLPKEDMVTNSPAVGVLKVKLADAINELIIIDREVFKNYLVKFINYSNLKVNDGYTEVNNVNDIFNISSVFGNTILELVDNNLEVFKDTNRYYTASPLYQNDVANKVIANKGE